MKKNLLILLCIVTCINKIHSQTNWELLNPKPTSNTGKDIDFVTTDIGYIITSNELLETRDAGNSWLIKQNIKSGNDMSFRNTTGFIVGDYGYVLKSVDSGTSWIQISTGFNDSFNTANIIDNEIIILSTANSIIKTDDGGVTWESFSIPNSGVNKTSFTSPLKGHAVCDNGTILKTNDGGQNWHTTQSTNTSPSDYFTVYFINENIGFASKEHNDIYKTTDAGETWVEISNSSSQAIYDFHFLDENIGFATGEHGATYKTTNGGTTWSQIFFQNGLRYNTSMYGIYFEDSNVGYATGARGRIIKTTDGGNTWTDYSINYNDFSQIQFLDNNTGFAQSGNSFFNTTDGGDNWEFGGSLGLINALGTKFTFIDETIGYASTGSPYGGFVLKTTDGGSTWTKLNNGYEIIKEGITSIFFLDENVGYISGGYNGRRVLKTTDGGNTWTSVLLNEMFKHMQFVNDLVGYGNRFEYSDGAMYKTIDGGNTWNLNIEVDEDITAFHFVDENNGYFVGDNALIYKTNDAGVSWQKLNIPYDSYTQVEFYSKNIGYIADEEGRLYKTENGGESWEYLTQQIYINSIELISDKIFTAGTNGKIYRSDVEYETISLQINPANNITNSSASLTGNATSNGESISNIQFEYSLDQTFSNIIPTVPSTVDASNSLNVSIDLTNLEPNTTYYYRLRAIQNSHTHSSQILSFKTLPYYEITTNFTNNYSSLTAEISGKIVSNEYDITNVEFQYGTSSDILDKTLSGTPTSVLGNTTEDVTASLINLEPETQYYYRIKATHQGDEIYGDILSFTTFPDFNIYLYNPYIKGTDVTLSANLTSYNNDITDILFEYGTIDYDNNVLTTPSQVYANNATNVSATITNLDKNLNYYYRLKAMHNGEAIYSEERIFNFSEDIIMVRGLIDETQTNSLELKGLINSYGAYLTNIHFEYGITNNFGSSITGTPNFAYGYNTHLITGLINNPLPNQTYNYRLVATNNGNTIYSKTYQYTTGTLSLTDLDLEQEILIYPNPATLFVNIKSNISEKIKSIEFYNTLGQRIYYENIFNTSDIKINVSNFKKGLYVIKLKFEGNKVLSSKLILN